MYDVLGVLGDELPMMILTGGLVRIGQVKLQAMLVDIANLKKVLLTLLDLCSKLGRKVRRQD